jgi:toxin ParE1/3/4
VAQYRLAASADADIVALLAWTEDRFGELVRSRYEILLMTGLRDAAAAPDGAGTVPRPDLGITVRSYHLRNGRKRARALGGFIRHPRHLLLYRILAPDLIGVGRVLHDAMELERHLPPDYGEAVE